VHLHLQLNRNRLAVQGSRLILPLRHGFQRRIDEERMSAHHACLDDIPVFINQRLNNQRASNVRLSRERRILRIREIRLARRFNMPTNPHDFLRWPRHWRRCRRRRPVPPKTPPTTPPICPPIAPPGTPPGTPPKSGAASPTFSEPEETLFGIAMGAVRFCNV
jgi:hypothetical protein